MRAVSVLALLVLLSGCGAPESPALDAGSQTDPDVMVPPPPREPEPIPQAFLNETFSLEVFAYRNGVSYTAFNNAANCVKLDGQHLVEFVGTATWSPTSEFTRNLRVAVMNTTVVNQTVGTSPLDFAFVAGSEAPGSGAWYVGVLLQGDGFAVKQPVALDLSVRALSIEAPSAKTLPCPAQ